MAEYSDADAQRQALQEPFPKHAVKNSRGLTYIPIAEVVARMNATVGVGNWRVEIANTWTFGEVETAAGDFPSQIVVQVRVHVLLGDTWTWCDGMGGQGVETMNATVALPDGRRVSKGLATDLGDTFKGAASDATKKALQHLGVALELARSEEAVRHERRSATEASPVPTEPRSVDRGTVPSPDAIAHVVATQVSGANAKAFMRYRRENDLPGDLTQMNYDQAAGLWAFLTEILA